MRRIERPTERGMSSGSRATSRGMVWVQSRTMEEMSQIVQRIETGK